MFAVWHRLVTFATCGPALLLLPAAQEKVCTWPEPVARTERAADADQSPTSTPDSEKPKSPLTLEATVPDVLAPRRPDHADTAAALQVQPLPPSAWSDRHDDQAGSNPHDADSGWLPAALWRLQLCEFVPPLIESDRQDTSRHQALLTCIQLTGPPTV